MLLPNGCSAYGSLIFTLGHEARIKPLNIRSPPGAAGRVAPAYRLQAMGVVHLASIPCRHGSAGHNLGRHLGAAVRRRGGSASGPLRSPRARTFGPSPGNVPGRRVPRHSGPLPRAAPLGRPVSLAAAVVRRRQSHGRRASVDPCSHAGFTPCQLTPLLAQPIIFVQRWCVFLSSIHGCAGGVCEVTRRRPAG